MDIQNRRELKAAAAQSLAAAPGKPSRTALIYVGVTCLVSLLLTASSVLLDSRIANTGGLGNLGVRSVLETIQTVLPMAASLAMLCWELGYQEASLRMARRQHTDHRTLLGGFRRFGPLLRATLLQGVLYCAVIVGSVLTASQIFMMLPLSNDLYDLVLPLAADAEALQAAMMTDESFLMAMLKTMLPAYLIALVIFVVISVPLFYTFRMVPYCLIDNPGMGAIAAMRQSSQMMRRNRISLLKLDLSFWWFYAARVLIALVAYGDAILGLLGVTLPISATIGYYGFYIFSLVLQIVCYYFLLNRVETTYAMVYDILRPKPQTGGAVLGNIFDLAKDYRED